MTSIVAALAMAMMVPVPPQQETRQEERNRIDRLIEDLGSDRKDVRDQASQELGKFGDAAIPQLKRAAGSDDAEKAIRARGLLLELAPRDPKQASPRTQEGVPSYESVYHDWVRGIHLRRTSDGKITLTIPEEKGDKGKREFKTYEAGSIEEFKKERPEIAKKYDLDNLLVTPREASKELQESWDRTREWLGLDEQEADRKDEPGRRFKDFEDIQAWIRRQEKALERRMKEMQEERDPAKQPPSGPTFGILVGPVSGALRSQLGIKDSEGLLVFRVEKDSLAEKSGVKQYDVLTKLDGKAITDFQNFRNDLEKAMALDRFSIEVIRNGKRQTLEVASKATK